MSRDLTTAYKTEITSAVCRPFFLFQAFFDSGTIRFWNGEGTLTYSGDTYTGAGHLLGMSQIDETTKVESRGNGFVFQFDTPLDRQTAVDPGSYRMETWNYHYSANYGSRDFKVSNDEIAEGGRGGVVVQACEGRREKAQ